MRKQWFTLFCCSIGLLAGSSNLWADTSPDSLWSDVSSSGASLARQNVASSKQTQPKPAKYRLVTLDIHQFQNISAQVPQGRLAQRSQVYISVPMPEGGFQQFALEKNQVMSPELAAKFPEIQTFTGYATDEPGVTARFEWTPGGFHGYVTNSLGTIFIDPFTPGDTEKYMVYYRRDARKADGETFSDVYLKKKPKELTLSSRVETANKSSGTQLRTYRLAVSATAEYTKFHQDRTSTTGKTAAAASIVSAVNRVTGVYERDVAVSFTLIGNNDQIIYEGDPANDPFKNDGPTGGLLDENQINTDKVIGDANYDVGHIFGAGGGGGVAGPGPCISGSKATGVTKSPSPFNDPFWIDFVAHEIGHQFSADHTFNSVTGSCAGNRSDAVPYEPGSGTTIMAYANICGADNIQTSSDAYFHTASIDEIINYTTGSGAGATCGTTTATGNNPPTVEAGNSFTIPRSTPFALTGSANDPDGDTGLTYTWEQFDKEDTPAPGAPPAGGPPETPSAKSPLFRSFLPASTPTRLFPQLSDILSATATKGEILPAIGRDMNFRLTVRDNKPKGGGMDYDATIVKVVAEAGPFKVTAPGNVGNVTNSAMTVIWDVANTTAEPVSCANVDILLSTDGGSTFPTVLADDTPNDGSEAIKLPSAPATGARIKVMCSNNIFFNISSDSFCINAANIDPIGFECGIPEGWTQKAAGANAGWELSTAEKKSGAQSLKSASIKDNETASISIEKTFLAGPMTFWLKTSTEAADGVGFDFFRLFVDGVEKIKRSGNIDWTQETVLLTEGSHVIRWEFKKDFIDGNPFLDAVWIDDVVLPILKAPGAPTGLSASVSSTSVSIGFEAPASNGGSAITGYTATCGNLTTNGTSLSLVVSGLTLGTTYSCTVTATNANGTGAAGSVSVTTSSGLEEFVKRFYKEVLGRTADSGGLADWVSQLQAGTRTGADIAAGFIFSQEFINRGTDDSAFLDILYRAFFNREPDPGGKSGWANNLSTGTDRNTVLQGFTGSAEFAALANSFGIKPDKTPVEKFVTRFYQQMLQRDPDPGGLTGWTKDLTSKTKTGADIARGFVFSQEFLNRDLSNNDFVTILYRAFFGREPDTGGFDNWIAQLESGTSRGDVLNGFLAAQEFANLAASFGITAN